MTRRTFPLAVLTVGAMLLASCGGSSPTGNSGDALTAAEANLVAAHLFALLQLVTIDLFGPTAAGGSPAAVPYGDLYDDQIDGSLPCALGGTGSIAGTISGDVTQETGEADLSVNATADWNGCVLGEGQTVTLDGNPDVGITAHILFGQTSSSIDLDGQGNVSYSTNDGRSGTCGVDMSASVGLTQSGINQTLSGTVCGVDASTLDLQLITD